MAVTLTLNNPHLAGLPIIVSATATDHHTATFHRVRIIVTVTPSSGTAASFEFSMPVQYDSSNNVVDADFDISSAVRAVADQHKPQANVLSYVTYGITIASYEDYMVDGQLHTVTGASLSQAGDVYAGTLSDYDRLFSIWPAKWSRKPTSSPMIAFTGATLLVPGAACNYPSWTAPVVATPTVPSGLSTTYNTYGIDTPADGYEIRFINSLGVHENVFICCLRQTEVTIQTNKYAISKPETLTDFSRGIAIKQNNRERWKMTSGPLDEQWQQWYLHEFLMARWAWINCGTQVSPKWIPVNIIPEDTVKGIDRTKADMLTVDFTIEFDINGSPFA